MTGSQAPLGDEWHAARDGCAVFTPTHRGVMVARGDDRLTFLQGMLSNDVKSLAVGRGVYAAFLTQAGKIVADVQVFAEEDRVLLLLMASRLTALRDGLERFIVADDVELGSLADLVPLIGLEGPRAGAVLQQLLGEPAPAGGGLGLGRGRFQEQSLVVLATSELDGHGYLVAGPPAVAAALLDAARNAGATPIRAETLNVLRVEAGIPWYGVDMDEDVLLMETNLERAISFTKGCYLGQEVVERIAARGHVNRKLSGLALEGETVPPAGSTLSDADHEVGRITSAVRSPALDRVIALGYVHRTKLDPGTRLHVDSANEKIGATVTALPFVRSSR